MAIPALGSPEPKMVQLPSGPVNYASQKHPEGKECTKGIEWLLKCVLESVEALLSSSFFLRMTDTDKSLPNSQAL